jgi:HD superfamily phosphodiesterase
MGRSYTRSVRGMPSVADAEELARELLEPLANRWAHVQAVAARADELTPAIQGDDERQLLVVAAWLHDLGYSPALRDTECHQIDGARYLTVEGYPDRLCALVAHHSAASCEAEERDLSTELEAWPREESPVADALWMADMTTGPRGEELAYDERLSEILDRYEPDSIVGRSMRRAEPAIRGAIERTRKRMADAYTI